MIKNFEISKAYRPIIADDDFSESCSRLQSSDHAHVQFLVKGIFDLWAQRMHFPSSFISISHI